MEKETRTLRYIARLSECTDSELIKMIDPYVKINEFNRNNKFFDALDRLHDSLYDDLPFGSLYERLLSDLLESTKIGLSARELKLFPQMLQLYTANVEINDIDIRLDEFINAIPEFLSVLRTESIVNEFNKRLDLMVDRYDLLCAELKKRRIKIDTDRTIRSTLQFINENDNSPEHTDYVIKCIKFLEENRQYLGKYLHNMYNKILESDVEMLNINMVSDSTIIAFAHIIRYEQIKCDIHESLDLFLRRELFWHRQFSADCFYVDFILFDCSGVEFDNNDNCMEMDEEEPCCHKRFTHRWIHREFYTNTSVFNIDHTKCPCEEGQFRIR